MYHKNRSSRRSGLHHVRPAAVYIPSMARTGVPFKNSSSRQPSGGDRFIPDRSALDLDVAHYLLTESRKEKTADLSPAKEAYKRMLDTTLMPNRSRILAFRGKTKAATSTHRFIHDASSSHLLKPAKPRRCVPQTSARTLDAPEIVDDYCLNLLDWGSANVLSIALGHIVYLWNGSNGSTGELTTVDDDEGPVTSVSWAPDGQHLAIGLSSSDVQIWDSSSEKLLRTLKGMHQSRVGSLAWINGVLTTGGMDGLIVNNDVRVRSSVMSTYRGHQQEVCGLKWSGSGKHLASGGKDNLVHIWDMSMASSNARRPNQNQWLHRLREHTAAVKAIAWCPYQSNLLASGGGESDHCIKLWNTNTGACLNSVDTGSLVSSLLWSTNERELLSSHGYTQNQLTLWKYPSMTKIADLMGHTSRVLFMTQSPDGTVATAAGDETLRFWDVFGTPEVKKAAAKATNGVPFGNNRHSHIR